MYLLDTNVCIHLLNHRHSSPSDIALCSVVKAELLFGARHSKKVEANLQLLNHFFAPRIQLISTVLPFHPLVRKRHIHVPLLTTAVQKNMG